MSRPDGDRPEGAPPPPRPRPNPGPPKGHFANLSAADRLRVVEILRPGWDRALARYVERKQAEREHARAA